MNERQKGWRSGEEGSGHRPAEVVTEGFMNTVSFVPGQMAVLWTRGWEEGAWSSPGQWELQKESRSLSRSTGLNIWANSWAD